MVEQLSARGQTHLSFLITAINAASCCKVAQRYYIKLSKFFFQAGEEETEGFTKEVLMMWKGLAVEGGRCIAPRAGRKGINTSFCGFKLV